QSVSNTHQKQAKNEQFGRRNLRVFVDYELKMQFAYHLEPGAQNGLNYTVINIFSILVRIRTFFTGFFESNLISTFINSFISTQ
ncbi:MAG: hypothetical protein UZ05_CHB002001516, partial [Chlorobi bacterium OLB5]